MNIPKEHWLRPGRSLSDDIHIPGEHWLRPGRSVLFIEAWETQLRAAITEEPDPAKRFEKWLAKLAEGAWHRSCRLVFVEQPYLAWAEAIERVLAAHEKEIRSQVADEILYPGRDC